MLKSINKVINSLQENKLQIRNHQAFIRYLKFSKVVKKEKKR